MIDYLDFACGKCFTYSNPLPEDSQPAVGLDGVAVEVEDDDYMETRSTTKSIEGLKISSLSPATVGPGSPDTEEVETEASSPSKEPCYHYGTISDKIGEACACWLARWALDTLPWEDSSFTLPESRQRSKSVSSFISNKLSASLPSIRSGFRVPAIWGRGGLTAKWIAAVVSADTLFVKNERERYNFAKAVVELRRGDGILEEDEATWPRMFERGIHYENMVGSHSGIQYKIIDALPSRLKIFIIFNKIFHQPQSDHTFLCQFCRRHTGVSHP